ncbi:hypothetical protein GH714_003723 [Hevea brasiliensis]|uniref:Uncharacterized protein n=1 Tax=Hevea brasiliensis TaxID=3981 RepID=A0A6A6NFL4_HEVBR|nr:hypothetical protein GH714_003723 [Hevea brasiliensis]
MLLCKLSSSLGRGFVYDLVPTPPNDAGEPACSLIETTTTATFKDDKKKGSKPKSQPADSSTLAIDRDWVADARQVSRMLLGGVNVVGIYVWISDASFKNSTITLCQMTVEGVAEAAPILETDYDKRLLMHISYSPRRWTCRNCVLSSNITSSSIWPCDFKMGRVLSLLQTFRCTYNFKLSLPICQENTSNASTLSAILRHGISVNAKELKNANALIDGNLDDIIRSLHSRLDIICDEADEDDEDLGPIDDDGWEASQENQPEKPVSRLVLCLLRKTCRLAFPRRLLMPWLAGTNICDYLQPSETLEVLKDHCVELMSMEAPADASTILQTEVESSISDR